MVKGKASRLEILSLVWVRRRLSSHWEQGRGIEVFRAERWHDQINDMIRI